MVNNCIKLGVLVSGRGSNLVSILDHIERGELQAQVAIVLSNKESAPALEKCRERGITAKFVDPKAFSGKTEYETALIDELNAHSIDIVCLAGYMKILGKEFIDAFRGRIINIHPSLLPAFPGLNAQKQALDYGVKFSGCTVHYVDEGVDSGPIIMQSVVPVYDNDDESALSARILEQEHIIYARALQLFANGSIVLNPQRSPSGATNK
ncbi:MAG: phosphoribosylglycinamide formyltransferase [Candidatus Nitrohelix vancouverensis]|uniref:Phosphoribosylglycinamide formyltransferase n=1 Tax=Candidatus Nitrohelix vancouverensis TaxID=2705534 RepID=A0A7T0C4E4_9BACT|nr:MAG: phosphoribosylglycinamide formyltransferase [Candidatus Nitrohelix vancouverensis]